MNNSLRDRFRGCLIGHAVGDVLGAPVEFMHPGSFEPITDFRSGGSYGLNAGEWTDDTSLALCLADSLIEKEDFDSIDQLRTTDVIGLSICKIIFLKKFIYLF